VQDGEVAAPADGNMLRNVAGAHETV
jgi:hypothetical protein